MLISLYDKITQTTPAQTISVEDFIADVRGGRWRDVIEYIAAEADHDERKKLKSELLPYVTLSGTFSQRSEAGLKAHSGYIQFDFDDLGREGAANTLELLGKDPYVYFVARSASWQGLFGLIKIKPENHKKCFAPLT